MASDPAGVVERLARATNHHDLDAIVDCFAADYVNETPAHPSRGFRGSDQVRRNWAQILAVIPDITARILASAVDGETVWSEWRMAGTRADGTLHELRGVIIFKVAGELVRAARFYLEPVEREAGNVDDAVRLVVQATPAPGSAQ